MSKILCIDTALETGSVSIAHDGEVEAVRTNSSQMDHAAWLHMAAAEVLRDSDISLKQLDAVAVTSGPGSYTGLRVAMAAAKGFCYATSLPLITETTLKLIAVRAQSEIASGQYQPPPLICPMIDARRQEVFTALYSSDLQIIQPPSAVVLDENTFESELKHGIVIFAGNGAAKWSRMIEHVNAVYLHESYKPEDFARIAHQKFEMSDFTELAYSEPQYFKNVYTGK